MKSIKRDRPFFLYGIRVGEKLMGQTIRCTRQEVEEIQKQYEKTWGTCEVMQFECKISKGDSK